MTAAASVTPVRGGLPGCRAEPALQGGASEQHVEPARHAVHRAAAACAKSHHSFAYWSLTNLLRVPAQSHRMSGVKEILTRVTNLQFPAMTLSCSCGCLMSKALQRRTH